METGSVVAEVEVLYVEDISFTKIKYLNYQLGIGLLYRMVVKKETQQHLENIL